MSKPNETTTLSPKAQAQTVKAISDTIDAAYARGDMEGVNRGYEQMSEVTGTKLVAPPVQMTTSGGGTGAAGTTGTQGGVTEGLVVYSSGKPNYDASGKLKEQYAAQVEAELAGLKSAYDKALAGYNAAAEKVPETYQAARNAAAVQNAQEKRAFDERAAASGLNSGANAQAQLAMSSVYQSQLGALDKEQAAALNEIERQKADLQSDYVTALVAAEATGRADLANALYQEMIRVQGLEREDKQNEEYYARQDKQLDDKNAADERDLARDIALKYELIDPKNIGSINSLADLAKLGVDVQAAGGNDPDSPAPGKSYDNGQLTPDQVRQLQNYYGLTVDGMWGPASVAKTGMTADEAWAKYDRRDGTVVASGDMSVLSSGLVSGGGDEAIIAQAKAFVEAYPDIAWNSRTVAYILADSNLTAAERALFKGYLKTYSPTWSSLGPVANTGNS